MWPEGQPALVPQVDASPPPGAARARVGLAVTRAAGTSDELIERCRGAFHVGGGRPGRLHGGGVSSTVAVRPVRLSAMLPLPAAACVTLRPISPVVALCCSTAAAMAVW